MEWLTIDTSLTGNEEDWTFVGVAKWTQDHEGHIYPPVWSYPNFDRGPSKVPDGYAHELAREDYAFLTTRSLGDADVSVDYKCPHGAVLHGSIVFRAADSARFYVLDIQDMSRKGAHYELILWAQDCTGYRREIARGEAPHSIVSTAFSGGPKTRARWDRSSPDWVRVRVQASGTYIRVSADDRIVFDVRDRTYRAGYVGLVGRGAVYFRSLRVQGMAEDPDAPWNRHEGELPRFFYPGDRQAGGFNAYPVACRTGDGATLVAWGHTPVDRNPVHPRPRTIRCGSWHRGAIAMLSGKSRPRASDSGRPGTAPTH